MKCIVSVSKKHSSVWRIYYYDVDQEGNHIFKSKTINKLLIPFYKILKFHRTKVQCSECKRQFTFFYKWFDKKRFWLESLTGINHKMNRSLPISLNYFTKAEI